MNLAVMVTGLVAHLVPHRLALAILDLPPLARAVIRLLNTILPEGLQQVNVASGAIAGSRLLLDPRKQKYFWLGTYEPWVQEAILRHLEPGMHAWDVGAFIGYHTLLMRRVAGPGRVIAIEPDPVSRANLQQHLGINGGEDVVVLPVAVGAHRGRARLERLRGCPSGTKAVECEGGVCEVITLDGVLERFPAPGLVKMDIEGSEADALAGATRLLSEIRPVWVLELHGQAGEDSIKSLRKAGYEITHIGKWAEVAAELLGGGSKHVVALPSPAAQSGL